MKTKKEKLEFVRMIAYCAERAAEFKTEGLTELRGLIKVMEKQHRDLGTRMVGSAEIRKEYKSFPLEAAVDYFVAKVFADAAEHGAERTVTSLVGIRSDYVSAALWWADLEFQGRFKARLEREFNEGWEDVLGRVASVDYIDLKK